MPQNFLQLILQTDHSISLNHLYFINLIFEEYNTCKKTFEYVSNLCQTENLDFGLDYFDVYSKKELLEKFKIIELECKNFGKKPLVHIEAHGSQRWFDLLVKIL
jgi:hypothetical protein